MKPMLKDCITKNNINDIESPCYVLNYESLQYNVKLLSSIAEQSGAKILVALKGYSFWREFGPIREYLHGATCSGVNETRLAYEEIANNSEAKEICVFSPAYKESQIKEIIKYATHIIFNSLNQYSNLAHIIKSKESIQIGLRINPMYSEVETDIYNPCVKQSRLGIIPEEFYKNIESLARKTNQESKEFFKEHFDGLHFHTLCEQDSAVLERTLEHVIKHFGDYIKECKWINFGGGHHITRKDYDIDRLIRIIKDFKKEYNTEVFLEPGEAVGWQCGDLIGEVIDIVENHGKVAILDISASCHMPDCLEMPYRPECYKISRQSCEIEDDLGIGIGEYQYRFGGPTCLAGDIIGDYSFSTPLNIGDRIAFCDMMHYTIVKNTTFNGIELPSLGVMKNGEFKILKRFDYNHFKDRN